MLDKTSMKSEPYAAFASHAPEPTGDRVLAQLKEQNNQHHVSARVDCSCTGSGALHGSRPFREDALQRNKRKTGIRPHPLGPVPVWVPTYDDHGEGGHKAEEA